MLYFTCCFSDRQRSGAVQNEEAFTTTATPSVIFARCVVLASSPGLSRRGGGGGGGREGGDVDTYVGMAGGGEREGRSEGPTQTPFLAGQRVLAVRCLFLVLGALLCSRCHRPAAAAAAAAAAVQNAFFSLLSLGRFVLCLLVGAELSRPFRFSDFCIVRSEKKRENERETLFNTVN